MYSFLVTLLALDAIVLIAAVLMQAGKGGGVAQSFGGTSSATSSLVGARQAGDLLTKTSWWAGGIFIFLAYVLQLMSSRAATGPSSILDQIATPPAATAPATTPTPDANAPSALPLQPATPAPSTTPPQP